MVYSKFFYNELNTLSFVKGFAKLHAPFQDLVNKCNIYYFQHRKKKLENVPFRFHCTLDMEVEKNIGKVLVEANVQPGFSPATYSLSICRETAKGPEILRKFHFDYELSVSKVRPKPLYHLQYGGELTDGLNTINVNIDSLHPWLSVPRLHYPPMNFALLLDLVFCEFPSETTKIIRDNPKWRELIKKNEGLMLVKYYNQIHHFLSGDDYTSTNLFRDYRYGS